jgi:NTE family protein
MNRLSEISFNSSLMREMRAIAFVDRLIVSGAVRDGEMKRILIHAIEADAFIKDLGAASKLNADWRFLTRLRDAGRACAADWLAVNYDHLGERSTVDISAKYL